MIIKKLVTTINNSICLLYRVVWPFNDSSVCSFKFLFVMDLFDYIVFILILYIQMRNTLMTDWTSWSTCWILLLLMALLRMRWRICWFSFHRYLKASLSFQTQTLFGSITNRKFSDFIEDQNENFLRDRRKTKMENGKVELVEKKKGSLKETLTTNKLSFDRSVCWIVTERSLWYGFSFE